MSYWMARVLDRANVRVVRWRVGSRQPDVELSAMRRFAATARREVQTLEAEPLRPRLQRSSRSGELWRSDQGDWLATRHPGATPGNTALLFLHGWLATPMHLRLMRRAAGPLLADGVELWLPRLPAHLE